MKKLLILISCLFLIASCKNNKTPENEDVEEKNEMEKVADMHTSEIALDWQGTYSGVLPCADCDGIETEIILNDDLTYEVKRVYLDKSETVFEEIGKFKWTKDGGNIVLTENEENAPTLFKVGENYLLLLDQQGNVIKDELAENYRLLKAQ